MSLNLEEIKLLQIFFSALILFVGYWLAKWISKQVAVIIGGYMSKHEGVICQRLIFYSLMLLFLIAALQQLGFKLGVLLGAAGVFTVGIGFAAQTSLANLISGIFLLIEHPFKIGDSITVKGFTGVVESIDLLSTRLCTSDNMLVRIPNQNIMQAEIINLSYFPKRRIDLIFGLKYGTDIEKTRTILLGVAKENEFAIEDPPPKVVITNFGASSIDVTFMVWGLTVNATNLKNSLQDELKIALEKEGIEMPFPQLKIHTEN